MKTAVIIPCYNEEATIGKVVADFHRELPEATIYVGDNASSDGTAREAGKAGAEVVTCRKPGKGNMLRTLISKVDADVYLMVDGDDTYSSADAGKLVESVIKGECDMAVGDRLSTTYHENNTRPFHSFGNNLVTWLVNRLFGCGLRDVLSGYRAMSREFARNAPFESRGFEIETELTAFAIENGYEILEIGVGYRERPLGSVSKLSTFGDGKKILTAVFKLFRDYRPFLFFGWTALLIALVSLFFLIPPFAGYFKTGLVAKFPSLIFGCFLLTTALMSFFSGLVIQVLVNQRNRLRSAT